MDPLADALAISGVKGALSTRGEAGGHWSVVLDDYPGAALHAVTAGSTWLTVSGREPVELSSGDVVLLPAGTGPKRFWATQILTALPGLVHVRPRWAAPA